MIQSFRCVAVEHLFAYHDVQDHVIGVLHADRTDLSEISDRLLDVLLDDAVVLGNAHSLACKHC